MKRLLAGLAATALSAAALSGIVAPAAFADDPAVSVSDVTASWAAGTLRVAYSWESYDNVQSAGGEIDVLVDGAVVNQNVVDGIDFGDKSVTAARADSMKPAAVEISVNGCVYADGTDISTDPTSICSTSTVYSTTLNLAAPKGDVSALTLLNKLHVTKEKHASTYKRSKFKLWIDANHDGENTRAEVLKAEAVKHKVKKNSHDTVTSGHWTSLYDSKTVTTASKLDIDHLVPLEEAWTSGAYKWSATKREAYANDLGYPPALIAVSAHANRSKGDREPNAYLPPTKSYDCTYVRNWIAVKSRWGLSVNAGEKAALTADLSRYCTLYWVTTPPKPNVDKLVGAKKKTTAPGSSTSTSSTRYLNGVHPGSFCSPDGALGYTVAGTLMECQTSATDYRDRWRRA